MLFNSLRRQVVAVNRVGAHGRLLMRRIPRQYYSQEAQTNTKKGSQWVGPALFMVGTFTAASLAYAYKADLDAVASRGASSKTTIEEASEAESKLSKEASLNLSPGHEKVGRGFEDPGVYAWGANSHGVIDPSSSEPVIKTPRRIKYFDGKVLRDLKLDQTSGAAILENGDLVQWGKGFSETNNEPTQTLTGKDLVSLHLSRDRIIALSSSGQVYSLPISQKDQQTGRRWLEKSWIPSWSSKSSISYRILAPQLGLGEKVVSIAGGQEHVLLLTNSGRVFSAAAATESYPSRGQLGIPGLTWSTRPAGPVDSCHEVKTGSGTKITQIAAGDFHSMLLDKSGQIYVFGDNTFGQLGLELDPATPFQDKPTILPLKRFYSTKKWLANVTGIAAGGANSFITVDARALDPASDDTSQARVSDTPIADTWALGRGITGALGTGRWTHIQDTPSKVKALSGLREYDDAKGKVTPIRLQQISVGATHAAAVLDNKTRVSAGDISSVSDMNWGRDALWWGGNEYFQLGTGKRNNLPVPTHIQPPDDVESFTESRFQLLPRHKSKVGKRTVSTEQKIQCGRHVSAVYSAV